MTSPTADRRQGLVGNTPIKAPVVVASTSNITLSGQQTIDGVAVLASNAAGVPDRVLVTGQTNTVENGIYDVNTAAWTRSLDCNKTYDLAQGSIVAVTQGAVNSGFWKVTTSNPITIGTSALTWTTLPLLNFLDQFFLAAPTQAGILAARALAVAAGGGTVVLPAATITLTAPLPVDSNVKYVGIPPVRTYYSNSPGDFWTLTGGTILKGDGTFTCFPLNNVALGAPLAPWYSNAVSNFGLENIGFDGFLRGVDMGATNAAGPLYSAFQNLFFINCRQWGFNVENDTFCKYDRIFVSCETFGSGTPYSDGFRHASSLPSATYIPTNSEFGRIFVEQKHVLGRGIVFEATASTAILNQVIATSGGLQCNRFLTTTFASQAATMANTSSNITITDGTKFRVGQPVRVSATANGFTAAVRYFVKTIVGNVITLASDPSTSAAAIVATGNTAVNIVSNGMANMEVIGTGGGGFVTNSTFLHLDLEGTTEAHLLNVNAGANTFGLREMAGVAPAIVSRGTSSQYNTWECNNPNVVLDFDANSTNGAYYTGAHSTCVQFAPPGQAFDSTLSMFVQRLVNGKAGNGFDFGVNFASGSGRMLVPGVVLGGKVQVALGTPLAMTGYGGSMPYGGSGVGVWTLGTILNAATNASWIGMPIEVYNCSAFTLTLNTDGTQLFNSQAGKTSITIPAGESVLLRAGFGLSNALTWLVMKSSGCTW